MNKTCGSCDNTDDVEEDNMDKKDKPRICEILGVEEDEVWEHHDVNGIFRIHNGVRQRFDSDDKWRNHTNEHSLLKIINHPERIIHKPLFTEEELAFMQYLYKYGVREIHKPSDPANNVWIYGGIPGDNIRTWSIMPWCLSSLHPGQSVQLSEIFGED